MKPRFVVSFAAKILGIIGVAMLALMGVTIYVVNSHVSEQLERGVAQSLRTSDAVFCNLQRARAKQLLLRFGNVPNEPRFKAAARSAKPAALQNLLKELVVEHAAEAIVFAGSETKPLASVARRAGADVGDFEVAAQKVAERARTGTTTLDIDYIAQTLYQVIGVPVVHNGQTLGVLVVIVEFGQSLVREFQQLTAGDVALLAEGAVTATTLPSAAGEAVVARQFADVLAKTGGFDGGADSDVSELLIGGKHLRAVAGRFKSLTRPNGLGYVLVVSYESELAMLRATQHSLFFVGLTGVTIAMLLAWLLVRRITQPLRQLRDIAVTVGQGDFSRQAVVESHDECGQLATAFNTMTHNLASARQELENTVETLRSTRDRLTHSEKLSAIGEFVAGVTHELNNPLTSVIGFAELLQQTTKDDRPRRQIDIIAREAHRCRKIVQSLLTFSRQHKIERKRVNLSDVVDSAIDILAYQLRTGNIEVERRLTPQLPAVLADPHQLQQVIINLLNNSRQALENHGPGGRIRIMTHSVGGQVEVCIQDNGPGIPPEMLNKIFDPFFTTKEVGQGTGLGLSLCYGIVENHGGSITAQSEVGAGATFCIRLPADTGPDDVAITKSLPAKSSLAGAGKRVLIVDDEEGILALTRDVLLDGEFEVETAPDGETGLRKARAKPFDVILCDWKMPGITGGQVYEQLRCTHPELATRMVFMTGDVVSESTRRFLDQHERACIAKPFSIDEFQNIIAGMLFEHQN